MGSALIVENLSEGLYRIQILRDYRRLDREEAILNEILAEDTPKWFSAQLSLMDLERERDALKEVMLRMIDLWAAQHPATEVLPPAIPSVPNNPDTGLPWANADEGLREDLFNEINLFREQNELPLLERSPELDLSLGRHCNAELNNRSMPRITGAWGSTPQSRAFDAGFFADPMVPVLMLVTAGNHNMGQVAAGWEESILDLQYTHVGVFFRNSPYAYVCAVKLAAETDPEAVVAPPERDPVSQAADETSQDLEKVRPPDTPDVRKELLAAGRELAEAGNRVRAAERELLTLRTELDAKQRRLEEIALIRAEANQIIHAWHIRWNEDLQLGTVVRTYEVPGFFERGVAEVHTTTFGVRPPPGHGRPVQDYTYDYRPVVILPAQEYEDRSVLRDAREMSDAAVFWNAAMEPGHFRWNPIWQFGTLIAEGEYNEQARRPRYDVLLDRMRFRGGEELWTEDEDEEGRTLHDVEIWYPPCTQRWNDIFWVGQKIVIYWHQREPGVAKGGNPYIAGFQREPRPCRISRSWMEPIPTG